MTDQPDDDLQYEDIDDTQWIDADDIEAIDLDALDDEIVEKPKSKPKAKSVLDTLTELDDAVEPGARDTTLGLFQSLDQLQGDPQDDPAKPTLNIAAPELEAALPTSIHDTLNELDEGDIDDTIEFDAITIQNNNQEQAKPEIPASILDTLTELDDASDSPEAGVSLFQAIDQLDDDLQADAVETAAVVAEPEKSGAGEKAAPPDLNYRVSLLLPPELAKLVEELRDTGEIEDVPPPGIELTAAFRTSDMPAVEKVLDKWAKKHLPIQLEITGVLAQVLRAREYIAAWTLQPEEELYKAQQALMKALEPLIVIDMQTDFEVRVTIGERIAPRPYPALVAQMQRDFDSFIWNAESLSLLQAPLDSSDWQTARSFT